MTFFFIWKNKSLESNLESFNRLNNLRDLPLTPLLEQFALRFSLAYPNNEGTLQYSQPIICNNPNSKYFNAVAMPVLDNLYYALNSSIISDLMSLGVRLPDEGLTPPLIELPDGWFLI